MDSACSAGTNDSETMCRKSQSELPEAVKQVHSELRETLRTGLIACILILLQLIFKHTITVHVVVSVAGGRSPEEVWSEHLKKERSLKAYASSMCALANGPWAKHGGGRIKWCIETCL